MVLKGAASVLVGVIVWVIVGVYNTRTAQAAVNVRPKLAEVGFVDAALSGHTHDWLFYHEPAIGWAVVGIIIIPIASGMVYVTLR